MSKDVKTGENAGKMVPLVDLLIYRGWLSMLQVPYYKFMLLFRTSAKSGTAFQHSASRAVNHSGLRIV